MKKDRILLNAGNIRVIIWYDNNISTIEARKEAIKILKGKRDCDTKYN